MTENTKQEHKWIKYCKTYIIVILSVLALTNLTFCGWEIHLGHIVLGSILISSNMTIIGIFSFVLRWLFKHREKMGEIEFAANELKEEKKEKDK